jgi:hypothetical protein
LDPKQFSGKPEPDPNESVDTILTNSGDIFFQFGKAGGAFDTNPKFLI